MLDIRTYGGVGDGVTDNSTAIQKAINDALTPSVGDSTVYFPAGKFLVKSPVVPALYNFTTRQFASLPDSLVKFQGAGQNSTSLVAGSQFVYTGMIGYGISGVLATVSRLDVSDLTLDGNYAGAGGTLAQPPTQGGALVSLPWPGTTINTATRTGKYHTFTRVRFYRPTGYGFQPTQGIRLLACEFDHMGQPDQATLHYDNMGSGPGDAVVSACNWHDCAGNYADFVSPAAGGFIRLVMTGCTSFNHAQGGIYAAGNQSAITGNSLTNNAAGSGVGYDVGTNTANRSRNVVSGNSFVNLVVGEGLSSTAYGDLFAGLNALG